MSLAMRIVLCRLGISTSSNAGWHQVIFLFSIESLEAQLKRHPILSVYDMSRPPKVVLIFPFSISSLFKSQFSLLQVCYKWWTIKKTFQQNEHVFGLFLVCWNNFIWYYTLDSIAGDREADTFYWDYFSLFKVIFHNKKIMCPWVVNRISRWLPIFPILTRGLHHQAVIWGKSNRF